MSDNQWSAFSGNLAMRSIILSISLLLAGCTFAAEPQIPADALKALKESKTFELVSLSPQEPAPKEGEKFHDWLILGSTKVKAEKAKELVAALQAGVAENTDGIVAACFNPRHGIRVELDGKKYDFVICFECYSIAWFIGDERQKAILTTGSPQPKFDAVLKEAKVKLPEAAK
jgi:hypothetical protein